MRALALAVFLAGCVHGPRGQVRRLSDAELEIRADAELEWAALEQEPIGADCDYDRPQMRVIEARDHAEMYSLTGYCGPSPGEAPHGCRWGRASAAYRRAQTGGPWPFALGQDWWPGLVIWADHDAEEKLRLVRHEVMHWLSECASGDPDHMHRRNVFRRAPR